MHRKREVLLRDTEDAANPFNRRAIAQLPLLSTQKSDEPRKKPQADWLQIGLTV